MKAKFTSYKFFKKESFKYKLSYLTSRVREKYNLCINSSKNIIGSVRWGGLFSKGTLWLFESLIDGLVINYCLFVFFNYDFNFKTILACGIAIKYFLYVWFELKKPNGEFKTIRKNQP